MKIKDLVGDLSYEEIKKRRWRTPRLWKNGKKILFNDYVMANDGIIMRIKRGNGGTRLGRIMNPNKNNRGYKAVTLLKRENKISGIIFHRLLWETWMGRISKKLQINHKDGVKFNNDLKNLEVITHKENIQHAIRIGLNWTEEHRKTASEAKKGEKNPSSKLMQKEVERILIFRYKRNYSQKKIAKFFKVSRGCVNSILQGYNWNPEKLTREELREKYGN